MGSHFWNWEGVKVVFGMNGLVWIEKMEGTMENMAKLRNLIILLSDNGISLHPKFLENILTRIQNSSAKDLLLKENQKKLIAELKSEILGS